MFESKRGAIAGLAAILITGTAFALTPAAKPPKSDPNRITRQGLGFSFVSPQDYVEKTRDLGSFSTSLVLEGPHTQQSTTVYQSKSMILNEFVGTNIVLLKLPRQKGQDFDEVSPSDAAKGLLGVLNVGFKASGLELNYQNSALIDVSSHPAIAILAETSVPGLNDRVMLRFVVLNHRDKMFLFIFQSNDTEFETKVPAFDAFMHSLKFTEPNVAPPTPNPSKPINIRIGS